LGVNETTLRNWVADHLAEEARQADPLAVSVSEFEELGRLRREVAELRTEREILRRAAAYFAQETTGLPLPVRRRAATCLRRQAALSGLGSLPVGVLRLARPVAVGAVGERRRARRDDRGDP
jgi:transposase-like protein